MWSTITNLSNKLHYKVDTGYFYFGYAGDARNVNGERKLYDKIKTRFNHIHNSTIIFPVIGY